jgi:hypothetical protein
MPFANALLAVTKPEMLEGPAASSKKLQATSMAARSMLEEENEFLLRDLKSVEQSYGTDVLTLTVACAYLDRLLKNSKIRALSGPASHGYSSHPAKASIRHRAYLREQRQ